MLNTHLLKKAHAGQGKTACTLYKEGYNLYVLYEFQTLCSKGAPLFYWSVACSFIQSTKLVETDSGAGTSGRRNTLLMSPLTESNALMPAGFPGALSSLKSGLQWR